MRLTGKRALVTGAANGIGRVTATFLAREGARVVLADRDVEAGPKAADAIREAGGEAHFVETDVTDAEAVNGMVDEATSKLGGLDVFASIAGDSLTDDLLEIEPDEWSADLALNLTSHFLGCRAVLPAMIEGGGGSVIAVSSVNALWSLGEFGYSAAKAGLISLVKNLAVTYGPQGVRANVVCPGTIDTERGGAYWDERAGGKEKLLKWYPVGRLGKPEDVAHMVVYLASDESSFVSGSTLVIDGGLTAGSRLFGSM